MTASRLQTIRRNNAAAEVQRRLYDAITGGEFEVGSQLPSENELAATFGVSRPVIREALGGLRGIGMIESHTGRGSYVTRSQPDVGLHVMFGRHTVEEIDEVRRELEVPGAEHAALRRTRADVKRLAGIVKQQQACSDVNAWVELDIAFHAALAEATRNTLHVQLVRELRDFQFEQSVEMAKRPHRAAQATEEHVAILAAVESGDPEAAAAAMTSHLTAILSTFDQGPVERKTSK